MNLTNGRPRLIHGNKLILITTIKSILEASI